MGKQALGLSGYVLMQLSAGISAVWGGVGVYVLSTKQSIPWTTFDTFLLLCVSAILSILALLCSTLFKDHSIALLRAVGVLLLLGQLPMLWLDSLVSSTLCFMVLPAFVFTLSTQPSFFLLTPLFPTQSKLLKSVTLFTQQLGALLWLGLFYLKCNPFNLPPQLTVGTAVRFSSQLPNFNSNATPILISCAIIFLFGTILLTCCREIPQNKAVEQNIKIQEWEQIISAQRFGNTKPTLIQQTTLFNALINKKCVSIWILLFIIDIYPIYLVSNFKLIFLPLLGNDCLLTLALGTYFLTRALSCPVWGIALRYRNAAGSALVVTVVCVLSATVGFTSYHTPSLFLFTALLGCSDQGIDLLTAKSLLALKGIKLQGQLVSLRSLNLVLGFAVTPLFQSFTYSIMAPINYVLCLTVFPCLSLLIALSLFCTHSHSPLQSQKQVSPTHSPILKHHSCPHSPSPNAQQCLSHCPHCPSSPNLTPQLSLVPHNHLHSPPSPKPLSTHT